MADGLSPWERAAPRPTPTALDALGRGAGAGALATAAASIPWVLVYWARHRNRVDLPWETVVPHAMTWVLLTGVLIGAAARLALSSVARPWRTLWTTSLCGACAGLLPGVVGVAYFGGLAAPYAGTVTVLAACFGAVFAIGALSARWDHGVSWPRAAAAAALPISVIAPATFFAPMLDPSDPVLVPYELWMLLTSQPGLLGLGSAIGFVSGGLAGAWLAATDLLARRYAHK